MHRLWPLTARQLELDEIHRELAGADVAGVLIVGPAGVGRTRLATEIAREWDGPVRWVVTHASLSTVPLAAAASELVLVVDDAHLLDDASAAGLLQIARTSDIRLLLTAGQDGRVPSALTSLWKDGIVARIDLRPLEIGAVHGLLETVLDGQVDRDATRRLWERAGASLVYLRALVDALTDSDSLRTEDGVWRWDGTLVADARLRELVDRHIEHQDIGTDERSLLEMLAVVGPVEPGLVAGFGAAPLLALEAAGLVEMRTDGERVTVAVAHPLVREVLGARMPSGRRRAIVDSAVETFDHTARRRRGDLVRATTWALDAGRTVSPPQLEVAADEANALGLHADAERLARAAAAADPGAARAPLALAEALVRLGRYPEAEEVLCTFDARTGLPATSTGPSSSPRGGRRRCRGVLAG